jgi:hypothetical protein
VRTPFNRHRFPQLAADLAIVVAAWYFAFRLRFDTDLPVYYERYLSWEILGLVAVIKLSIFALFGFYNRWWRYVSTRDMWGAARGVVAASLVTFLVFTFFEVHVAAVPRTVWIIDGLLTLAFVAGSRMLARTIIERPQSRSIVARGKEVIVVGAGDAAQLILKEMLRTPALGYTPIGLIDDDPRKKNLRLHGIRVLGTTDELPHILHDRRPDELLIAIPSASGEARQRIVDIASSQGIVMKTLPGLHELIAGDLDLAGQIRPVEVEDVLGREPVEVDIDAIAGYLSGETVLVTGAGGSIGAELCRQISRVGPAPPRPRRSFGACAVRDRAGARGRARLPGCPAGARGREEPGQDASGLRGLPSLRRLPRRGLQARAADRVESRGGRAQQHPRHAHGRRDRGRVRRRPLRSHLDRQGRQPEDGDGAVQGSVRVDRRGVRASRRCLDPLRRSPFRQRARVIRLGDPDLPAPDREGRAADADASGDDALLHDDPRGGPARRPGGARSAVAGGSSCSTWGSRSRFSSSPAR